MSEKKFIEPTLASGFKDYLPEDEIARQNMFDTIRRVFERFGFLPLDTPGIEKEEILTGGDENFNKQLFRAGLKGGAEDLALRFDLTVPLARIVSMYQEKIEKPFKRYQIGKVWRGERPQAGRYREFVQFDADIVGSANLLADAEIIYLMFSTLNELGVKNFLIKINNRKILNGLSEFVGYDAKFNSDVLRIIDKLDKIGTDGVLSEIQEKIEISDTGIKKLKEFLEIKIDGNKDLEKVEKLFENSQIAKEGFLELKEINKKLEDFGVSKDFYKIDLSVARGLGYYTGTVYETTLTDLPSIGSVFSGGRYDDLVSRFSTQNIPAVGASVGVDRLFFGLEKLGLLKKTKTLTKVLVLNFDENATDYDLKIVSKLREGGINSEIYLGKENSLKGQLAYALKQEVPFVIIAGEKEKSENIVQVKDLVNRGQKEVKFEEILKEFKK